MNTTTNNQHLALWVPKLAGHRVLVVGDVILDEYLVGTANRLSREAPIPVLEFERRETIPGGAANPSANIVSLGSQAIQVGVVGEDSEAIALNVSLKARGIDTAGLVYDATRPTTTKTRIMAHMGLRFPQQVARIDRIMRDPIDDEIEQDVLKCLGALIGGIKVVVVSDYLSGMLTPRITGVIRALSRAQGVLATADAQGQLEKYAGFDLLKCNAEEAARFVGTPLLNDADFAQAGLTMIERLHVPGGILITRGHDGVTLAQPGKASVHIPAVRVEDVYDTVGAGDTALAVTSLALAGGASYPEAAALANVASGIVVRKVGNYAPTPAELLAALSS